MKYKILIYSLLILSLVGIVVGYVDVPVGQTTWITLGYGRSVNVKASGGWSPYSFSGSSCVSLEGTGDDTAKYTAGSSQAACTADFYDLFGVSGYIEFNVTCVCDYCTTSTDEAMYTSDNGITFVEIAYDDENPLEPDDYAAC